MIIKHAVLSPPGNPSFPGRCACCVAAATMLAVQRGGGAVVAAAEAAATTSSQPHPQPQALPPRRMSLLGLYEPDADVSDYASLDVQLRHVVAKLGKGTEEGLAEAREVYANGTDDGATGLTLKGLGEDISKHSWSSPTFGHFVDYYGEEIYGSEWIEAAFEGKDFYNFKAEDYPGKGHFQFSKLGVEGRAAAIRWGIPLLQAWMGVVSLVEKAAVECRPSSSAYDASFMSDRVAEWDRAAALYAGSESALYGGGDGRSVYSLTQVECAAFGTCPRADEAAPANVRAFENLRDGKAKLKDGDCAGARTHASKVKRLVTATLVQGVMRAAYAMDEQDDSQETTQGMGAAYAASLLPLLAACMPGNAFVVHDDLAPGRADAGSYDVVRAALERSYDCLGIGCDDVGGLLDPAGEEYLEGAGPCGNDFRAAGAYAASSDGPRDEAKGAAVGARGGESGPAVDVTLVVGAICGVVGGFLVGLFVAFMWHKSNLKKKTGKEENVGGGGGKETYSDTPEVAMELSTMDPKGVEGEII